MKYLFKTLVFIITLFVTSTQVNAAWEQVGNAGFTPGPISDPDIAFDGSTPYVAYTDYLNGSKTSVMKFDGTDWVQVGVAGFTPANNTAVPPSIAFDGSTPYVAYKTGSTSGKISVMKFDGTNWVQVGLPDFTPGYVSHLSVAVNGSTPYIAYKDAFASNKASVMRFDGTDWVQVGIAGFTAGGANEISLVFDGSTPYISYQDDTKGSKASVMKFDGTNWVQVGIAGFSVGNALYLSFAFDNSSTPYVAYGDNNLGSKASVMKFDGTDWVQVGLAGLTGSIDINSISIAFDGSTPYVVYGDTGESYKASAMKFDGTNWVQVGIAGFTADTITAPDLAFNNSSMPYVAYKDNANGFKASVAGFFIPPNASPSAISASRSSAPENTQDFGVLSTTDADTTDTHTYSFVSGAGDEDNAKFTLSSAGALSFISLPDFESPTDLGDTPGNNTYSVRVQTDDGNGGVFAQNIIITITDFLDTDNVTDAEEDAHPNAGDGNNDGFKDAEQNEVASKKSTVTGKYVTLAAEGATTCKNISGLNTLSKSVSAFDYPLGIFDFESTCVTPGDTMEVKIYLDEEYDTSNWAYHKYDVAGVQTDITDQVIFATELVGTTNVTTISYSVVDGGPLDEDGLVNGTIRDPAGPAIVKKKKSGSKITYVCKDTSATNYNNFGRHKDSKCEYAGTKLAQATNNVSSEKIVVQTLTTSSPDINCSIDYSRLIKRGVKGQDVRQVQTCMNSLGYTSGPEDGIYGPLTYAGITSYQQDKKLKVDGIVGPETSGSLNSLSGVSVN